MHEQPGADVVAHALVDVLAAGRVPPQHDGESQWRHDEEQTAKQESLVAPSGQLRSARSKNAVTRRSYSLGRASSPPTCLAPGTSQSSQFSGSPADR